MVVTKEAVATKQEEQLVIFELGNESYGVDIGAVNTIIRMQPVTHVPRAPEAVVGVINLRGSIVPVMDLRKRFLAGAYEETKASRIVVVETEIGVIGMIVDAVTETLSIAADTIEPPSTLVSTVDSQYLRGVAKVAERLIILLNIEKLFSRIETEAIGVIASTANQQAEEIPPADESMQ
jgi:purine-binding chemotaxis protein CheW